MYYFFYRALMKLAHRFDWHYAPEHQIQDGSTQKWCQWCGLRETYPARSFDWKALNQLRKISK